jgi:Mg2+ and Co2+ transporter CorA
MKFHIKRKLIEFSRIAADMSKVVNTVIRHERSLLGDDLDPYIRDVYDHLLRTIDRLEDYRDLLTGLLDFYLSAAAYRTNEVMKILTIWVAQLELELEGELDGAGAADLVKGVETCVRAAGQTAG